MKKLTLFIVLTFHFSIYAQHQSSPSSSSQEEIYVERENVKAFMENDLDKYVVYDLMSDGSKVFKDTLDFNEYRDKALFTLTQNQTILNRQNWATIVLLTIAIVLLVLVIRKK